MKARWSRMLAVVLCLFVAALGGCHLWYQDMKGYLEHWTGTVSISGFGWRASTGSQEDSSQKDSSGRETIPVNAAITAEATIANPEGYRLDGGAGTERDALRSVRIAGASGAAVLGLAESVSTATSISLTIKPVSSVPTEWSLRLEHTDFTVTFVPTRSDSGQSAPDTRRLELRYNTPPRMPVEVAWSAAEGRLGWLGEEHADGWKMVQTAGGGLDGYIYWAWPRSKTEAAGCDLRDPDCVKEFHVYVNDTYERAVPAGEVVSIEGGLVSPMLADYNVYRTPANSGDKIEIYALDVDGVKSQAAGSGIAPHRVILKTNGGFFPASGTAEVELYKAHESLIGGGDLETPYYDGDHHLSGWTRDGSPVTFPLKIDDPMTLIAQWEKNPPADTGTGGGTGSGSTGGTGAGTGTGAGGTGAGTGTGTGGGTGSGSTGGAGAGTGTGAGGTGTGTGTGTGNGTGTGTGASTYTVTYDKNKAGSGTEPQGQTKLAGRSLILQGNSGNLARDGYTFNGWNTSADGTGDSYQEGAAYTKDESVTLYAKWIMEGDYEIKYELDGGSHSGNPASYDVETPTITLRPATKTGYTFNGWHKDDGSQMTTIAQGSTGSIILTAQWTANTYYVKFEANGGSGSMDDQTFTYDKAGKLTANQFTRTGYTFTGWSGSDGKLYSNEQEVSNLTDVAGGTVTLYAKWIPEGDYEIKYELDGGSNGAGNPASYNVETPTITLSPATKTGYTFNGWHDGTHVITEIAKGSTGAITLTAQWTANTYYVKFEANGGSGSMGDQTFTYDKEGTLTANQFTRTGYTFTGWSGSDGNLYSNEQEVSNLTAGEGDTITLTAQWKAIEYTITYNLDGGQNNGNPASYTVDQLPIRLNDFAKNPTKTGYTFSGWHDGTHVITGIAQGTTGDISLTAQWTANEYTVTLNDGNGSGGAGSTTVTYDKTPPNVTPPTMNAYTFEGYWTQPNGQGKQYYDKDGNGVNTWQETAVTTLYAQWKQSTYTVKFNGNGSDGGGSMTDQTFTCGVDQTLPQNTFTRTGYTFAGWNEQQTGGAIYNDGGTVRDLVAAGGTVTLYAQWTAWETVEPVTFSHPDGTKIYFDEYMVVELSTTTPNATIQYHLGDGQWKVYTAGNWIHVSDTTITARATHAGMVDSAETQATYTVRKLTGITVTPPTRRVYSVGDTFDSSGMVVTATYDDGAQRDVTGLTGLTTDFDSVAATTGLGKNVTVSYSEGATASPNSSTFTVDVTYKFTETVQDVDSGYTGTMGGGRYVKFGDWPQKVMASGVTLDGSRSQTMGMFTCYLGSDGNWYVEAEENAYGSGTAYQYSNGERAGQGGTTTKWFKVEPIVWRVLTENYNGKALLLAEKVLTGGIVWDDDKNNYMESNIRRWLNGNSGTAAQSDYVNGTGFLQTAFTVNAQNLIAATTVDNSEGSTFGTGETQQANQSVCSNTTDKIFLLSQQEATTSGYGFAAYGESDSTRIRVTTDYAKATGANQDSTADYGGWWWLRSPIYGSESYARVINNRGRANLNRDVDYTDGGVVPALCVQLP